MAALTPVLPLPSRFVPRRRLGRGGLADVWAATDHETGRDVAVKVLHGHRRPALAARLHREARLLQEVDHPNILKVVDYGRDPVPWIATELHTTSLLSAVRDGSSSLDPVRVGADVLAALVQLHGRGVVHRDVKPGNVLVARDGRFVLCDLGIARDPDTDATRITHTDELLGSYLYMSPQQRRDPHGVDARADLYGVAATLWFVGVGRRPPDLSLLYLRSHLLLKLPEDLREVVRRGAAYRPEDRYPNAVSMAAALCVARSRSVRERDGR